MYKYVKTVYKILKKIVYSHIFHSLKFNTICFPKYCLIILLNLVVLGVLRSSTSFVNIHPSTLFYI